MTQLELGQLMKIVLSGVRLGKEGEFKTTHLPGMVAEAKDRIKSIMVRPVKFDPFDNWIFSEYITVKRKQARSHPTK